MKPSSTLSTDGVEAAWPAMKPSSTDQPGIDN